MEARLQLALNDFGKLKGELKEDREHHGWLKKKCEGLQEMVKELEISEEVLRPP